MKKEFENCGIAIPEVYLVMKGYSLGIEDIETGRVEVIYYSFAMTEELAKKLKEMKELGWSLIDGFKEDFCKKDIEEIEDMRKTLEKKYGNEEIQKKVLEFVRKKFFRWDEKCSEKINYMFSNEEDLEL